MSIHDVIEKHCEKLADKIRDLILFAMFAVIYLTPVALVVGFALRLLGAG